MSWPLKVIRFSYILLFVLVPLIFLPWTSELFEFNKIILTWVISVIILSSWAARCVIEHRFIFSKTPLDWPLIIFLGTTVISLLGSIDLRTSLLGYYGRWNGGLISLVSYVFLYWGFVSNIDKKFIPSLLKSTLVTAVVVAIYAIAQNRGIDDSMWVQDVKNRVFSTLGQPNWLAAYLVALIFIPLATSLTSPYSTQASWGRLTFLLLLIALIFTKSRSGFLAFGLSWLIFWIAQGLKPLKSRWTRTMWFLVIVLFLLIKNPARDIIFSKFIPVPPPPTEQSEGPALETGGTESGAIRKIVWTGALRIWQASPKNLFVGTGPETFAMAYYQYRPLEHNSTSEWELLYNKAHNEFLNQLATTGLLGLSSYLLFLATAAYHLFKALKPSTDIKPPDLIPLALVSGWVSLSVTNFLGFSVTPVQLLLFLFPAISQVLFQKESPPLSHHKATSTVGYILLTLILLSSGIILFSLLKYWLADIHYSSSQKSLRAFSQTEDPQYIVSAYQSASQAHALNPGEPFILAQLSESSAYLAIFTLEADASSSASLIELSQTAATAAIASSPSHPTHYKSASRSFILLSALDPEYLTLADSVLKSAQTLSPTDPRLPHQRGIIAKYQDHPELARDFFVQALKLKPDFGEAQTQLDNLIK